MLPIIEVDSNNFSHYILLFGLLLSYSTYLSQEISHAPACCTSYRLKEKTLEIGKETCSTIRG